MTKFYPLKLEPQLKDKVWGGHWLIDNLGRAGDSTSKLGESWEAFSGSRITNGVWQNSTLGQLYAEYGVQLAGPVAAHYPQFPLLVKFIDARENLSVQVHPDDALAQQLENYRFGKSEMWYIMAAEPGAHILYSLNDKASSREELGSALQAGTIVDYVNSVPVQAGDVVYLPSRTVHALCAGIVVYELQQESDITYRLYDWGRQGREIHLDKGLQALSLENRNFHVTHPQPTKHATYAQVTLKESPYFTCELLEVTSEFKLAQPRSNFQLLSVIGGAGSLSSPDHSFASETLSLGDTVFIPAGLSYQLLNASTPSAAATQAPLRVLIGSIDN
jgi:mannose-6-phosphate isomerase